MSAAAIKKPCSSGKQKYFDHFTAAMVALKIYQTQGEEVAAYLCKKCHWWHVGHVVHAALREAK